MAVMVRLNVTVQGLGFYAGPIQGSIISGDDVTSQALLLSLLEYYGGNQYDLVNGGILRTVLGIPVARGDPSPLNNINQPITPLRPSKDIFD